MAPALRQGQAAQRLELQTIGAGKHRSNGPQTHDALAITLDHPMGAAHAHIRSPSINKENRTTTDLGIPNPIKRDTLLGDCLASLPALGLA